MKERLSVIGSGLGIFLLLPLVLSFFLSGSRICSFQEKIDLEQCLPYFMALEVPQSLPMEALKAQAVILRSNAEMQMAEGESLSRLLTEASRRWRDAKPERKTMKELREAAKATRGEVLSMEGERVRIPYHELSAGNTRSGEAVLGSSGYEYLEAVESLWDQSAGNYVSAVETDSSRLPKRLRVLETDESGYVLQLEADGQILSGEYFRQEMGLPSSAFTIMEKGQTIQFTCRGRGHGLGLSQYGAGAMAEEGSSYKEILAHYFPKLKLEAYKYDEA